MKTRKKIDNRFVSRRQFLYEAGAFLALPPLLSLLPAQLEAQVRSRKIIRSMIYTGQLGIDSHQFFASAEQRSKLVTVPGEVSLQQMPLNGIVAPISRVIDLDFAAL